jgi:serine/threonine protein kinase
MKICFNDYVLHKKIGSGSFGDVWLGKHKSGEGPGVAVKLEPVDKENMPKMIYKETKILQSLSNKRSRD